MIQSAQSPEYQSLKKWLMNNPSFAVANSECVSKLQNIENMALPNEITFLKTLQIQYCSVFPTVLLEDRFFPGYIGMALPKGSPLNLPISKAYVEF